MDYKVDISQFTDEIKEIKYIFSNSGGEERKTSSLYFKKIQMKDLNDTQRNNILKYFSKYAEIMSRENEKNSLLQLKNYKEITEYYDNIQEIQKKIQQNNKNKINEEEEKINTIVANSKLFLQLGLSNELLLDFGREFRKNFIFLDKEHTTPFEDNGIIEQMGFDEIGVYSFLLIVSIPKSYKL